MVRQLGLRNIASGNTGWENNVFVEAALPLPKHTRDLLNGSFGGNICLLVWQNGFRSKLEFTASVSDPEYFPRNSYLLMLII